MGSAIWSRARRISLKREYLNKDLNEVREEATQNVGEIFQAPNCRRWVWKRTRGWIYKPVEAIIRGLGFGSGTLGIISRFFVKEPHELICGFKRSSQLLCGKLNVVASVEWGNQGLFFFFIMPPGFIESWIRMETEKVIKCDLFWMVLLEWIWDQGKVRAQGVWGMRHWMHAWWYHLLKGKKRIGR